MALAENDPDRILRPDPYELYRMWRTKGAQRYSPKTQSTYRYCITRFLADAPRSPLDLTGIEIRRYLESMRPHIAIQTRKALVDLYAFCVANGWRGDNPLDDVPAARRPGTRVKRGLTDEELTRLVIALTYHANYKRWRWQGERWALLAIAHALTGLRPGELLNLTTDRIILGEQEGYLELIKTKTGHDRIVPLSPTARRVFTTLVEGRTGRITDIGTTRYFELIQRAGIMAGIPKAKCRPYALRHTFAGLLVERGVHIRVVAELLGHQDLRSTLAYSTPSDTLLRDAVGRL